MRSDRILLAVAVGALVWRQRAHERHLTRALSERIEEGEEGMVQWAEKTNRQLERWLSDTTRALEKMVQ